MTTLAEVEWDDETRQSALALDFADRLACPSCGLPRDVCQAPENQDGFVQPSPVRCHATTARLVASARVTEETNPQADALLWPAPELRDGV